MAAHSRLLEPSRSAQHFFGAELRHRRTEAGLSLAALRVAAQALAGPEEARRVIEAHLRSDVAGRCLACRELEPCRQRDTAHAALFGHDRQLPRHRPMELIGARGDFATADNRQPFNAFGRSA